MFVFSSIIWEKNDTSMHEYLVEHSYNIKADLLKTYVNSTQSASYERELRYVLLKDYEEIELPWTDESGNRAATIINYKEHKENEGEQITRHLDITKEMGSGVYVLLTIENYDDTQREVRRLKVTQNTFTTRTMVIFNGEKINREKINIIDIIPIESKDESDIIEPVKFGREQIIDYEATEDHSTLSKLDLPICINFKPYLESISKDASSMNGKYVPILILGYYNGSILPQKYFCEIKFDSISYVYPEWDLYFDESKQNFLKIFVFCYPFDEIDKLENDQQKMLCADSLNAGIYFSRNE